MVKNIRWTNAEYTSVFKEMEHYYKKNGGLPSSPQCASYVVFMVLLSPERHRNMYPIIATNLRRAFFVWRENKDSEVWRAALDPRNKTSQPLMPAKEGPVAVVTPAPKVVSKPPSSVETVTQIAQLLKQTEESLIASLSVRFDQLDRFCSTKTLTPQPAPAGYSAIKAAAPLPYLPPKSAEVKALSVPNIPVFTESDIRRIVRQEIEAIFGVINPPAPLAAVPAAPFQYVKAETAVIEKEAAVEVLEKKRILIFGLNTVQLQSIRNQAPKHISIEGTDKFSKSFKDLGKNADIVLISKFTTHAVNNTMRSMYGEKAEFISGGVSMILARIKKFLSEQ